MKKIFLILLIVLCTLKIDNCPAQWVQMSNGIPNLNIYDYSIIGMNLFAASWGGVYRTTNSGGNWTVVNASIHGTCLTIHGTNLYVGNSLSSGGGILLSTNNGGDWTMIGLSGQNISKILFKGNNIFVASYGSGVFLSTDYGGSWTTVNNGFTNLNVYNLALSEANLFAGTFGGGVFLSTNNGENWNPVNNGLTCDTVSCIYILNDTNIFAGTRGGVFLSTNNGGNWTAVNNSSFTNQRVTSFAAFGTNLFAGTLGGSMGNYFGGVFLSTNYGENWINKSNGLAPSTYINTLFIANNYIFAGGYGVFRRDLAEILTGTQNITELVPSYFTLHQNYPNPFNPVTKIKFDIKKSVASSQYQVVTLKIFDILGKELATLVNEKLQPGTYEVEWNALQYASGVYFYRLQSAEFTDTKRMLMIK